MENCEGIAIWISNDGKVYKGQTHDLIIKEQFKLKFIGNETDLLLSRGFIRISLS